MSWGRIDDKFHSHRKVKKLKRGIGRVAAIGLWTLAGSYSNDHNTDGLVDLDTLADLAGSEALAKRLAAQLVVAGLWVEADGGWRFHDWLKYNKSAEDRHTESQIKSEAGRKGGLARAKAIVAATSASFVRDDVELAASKGVAGDKQGAGNLPSKLEAKRSPDPDPDPDPDPKEDREESPRKRGSRLPRDWAPTPTTIETLRHELRVDPIAALPSFRDYWLAATGAKATKADWDATFRNWVRRDASNGNLPAWDPPEPLLKPIEVVPPPKEAIEAMVAAFENTCVGERKPDPDVGENADAWRPTGGAP